MKTDEQTAEGMSQMAKDKVQVCTVADLISQLAALPPMMYVFVDADGMSMYLNWSEVQESEGRTPFLRLVCSEFPKRSPFAEGAPDWDAMSYEERLDTQRARAREMGRRSQEASVMPPHVR